MHSQRSTKGRRSARLALLVLALAAAVLVAAPAAQAYNHYFGDLHAHTGYSDGAAGTTPWDAFPAAIAGGADFMALTEHYSTSNAYEAWTMDEQEWQDLKAAAARFTSSRFVAMPAYEYYLVSHTGEINVFNVADLPPKMTFLGPDRLPLFCDWVAGQPGGVGQFNHPTYVSRTSRTSPAAPPLGDEGMGLLEVYNDGFTEASYVKALDAGWHVMPSANSDTHAADWITGRDMRTVLLADALTPADLYAAMRAQRGYATLDKDLCVTLQRQRRRDGLDADRAPPRTSADVRIWDPDALAGRASRRRHARGDRL